MRELAPHGMILASCVCFFSQEPDIPFWCIQLQVPQRRTGGFAAGVAADHAATLLPAALAFDLVGGRAVLGHAPGPCPRARCGR